MSGRDLLNDIGYIHDELVEEAALPLKGTVSTTIWRYSGAAVAVFAIGLTLGTFLVSSNRSIKKSDMNESILEDAGEYKEAAYDMLTKAQGVPEEPEAEIPEAEKSVSQREVVTISDFLPEQPYNENKDAAAACYKSPDPGEYFCFIELQNALEYYSDEEVIYLYEIVIDVFGSSDVAYPDGWAELSSTAQGRELLHQECERLESLGYDIELTEEYLLQATLTKDQIENFAVNPVYGYALRFAE